MGEQTSGHVNVAQIPLDGYFQLSVLIGLVAFLLPRVCEHIPSVCVSPAAQLLLQKVVKMPPSPTHHYHDVSGRRQRPKGAKNVAQGFIRQGYDVFMPSGGRYMR